MSLKTPARWSRGLSLFGLLLPIACRGDNSLGQVTPPAGTFTQVSAGQLHTCGLTTAGTVACWGYNASGQATPPPGAFAQVSAGGSHTCGLVKVLGVLLCWGNNY